MTRFDAIVVGTSPLMLLQAHRLAGNGKHVAIVDRAADRGGLWRNITVGDEVSTEVACHLIEPFPDVYEYLETVTEIPFEPLDPQPMRIEQGRVIAYSSRFTIFAGVALGGVRFATLWTKKLARGLNRAEATLYQNVIAKMLDFFRYQLPIMIRGPVIKAPVTGFSHFIDALVEAAERTGARFISGDVEEITRAGGDWTLRLDHGATLSAAAVYVSASSNLRRDAPEKFVATPYETVDAYGVLIEVPHTDLRVPVSYAVFPNDEQVARVSRIDQRTPRDTGTLFLVQLKGPIQGDPGFRDALSSKLQQVGIIARSDAFGIIGDVNPSFTPYALDVQLPDGEIAPSFFVASSAGNLASGISCWLAGRRRFSPKGVAYRTRSQSADVGRDVKGQPRRHDSDAQSPGQ